MRGPVERRNGVDIDGVGGVRNLGEHVLEDEEADFGGKSAEEVAL